jgi:cyanophycin synthetase
VDNSSLVQFGYGKHIRRIRASCSRQTSEIATEIAGDKELTNYLLVEAGLPAPRGTVVTSATQAADAAQKLGFPVVIKPVDGNHGRGVSIGLASAIARMRFMRTMPLSPAVLRGSSVWIDPNADRPIGEDAGTL